jgi:hypothetical protein
LTRLPVNAQATQPERVTPGAVVRIGSEGIILFFTKIDGRTFFSFFLAMMGIIEAETWV